MPPFQGLPRVGVPLRLQSLPQQIPAKDAPMNQLVQAEPESLLKAIAQAAQRQDVDALKIGALLRMHGEMTYNAAMAEVQAEIEPIARDATNSFIGNRYATLSKIISSIQPIYTKYGFNVRFRSGTPVGPGWVKIICVVSRGVHSETLELDSPIDNAGSGGKTNKTPVQAIGSTVSYLRRYLVCMAFNIVLADDDDGEGQRGATRGASHFPHPTVTPPEPPPPDAPRKTIAEWLDDFAVEIAECEWVEELDSLMRRDDIRRAAGYFKNGALERFNQLTQAAYDRVRKQETELQGDAE